MAGEARERLMAEAHLPAWLEDPVAALAAEHEAEAVLLFGAHARGEAGPGDPADLLVLVDAEQAPRTGWPLLTRFAAVEGYRGPVRTLLAPLAEVVSGVYAGHAGWRAIAAEAVAVHDPLGLLGRIRGRLTAVAPAIELGALLDAVREAAASGPGAAAIAEHAGQVAQAALQAVAPGTDGDGRARRVLLGLAPGAVRAWDETLEGTLEDRRRALLRMVEALEAGLRLRGR